MRRPIFSLGVAMLATLLPTLAQSAPRGEGNAVEVNRAVAFVGYGTRVVPKVPFEVGRLANDDEDLVFVHQSSPARKVLVAPNDKGMGMKLAPGTTTPDEVFVQIDQVTRTAGWRLESSGYSIPLLPGLSAWSTKDGTRWTVELTIEGASEQDEMLYVEGPFANGAAPKLDSLVDKNMKIATKSSESLEVTYLVGEALWRQRRRLVSLKTGAVFLVTAQAPSERAGKVFGVTEQIARELKPSSH